MKWVTTNKLAELTGYTENAIRAKKKTGIWIEGKHWFKAPDNKPLFNIKTISEWVEGN